MHTETEIPDHICYFTQSQYTDSGPTSPSTNSIMPATSEGSHWRTSVATGEPVFKDDLTRESGDQPSSLRLSRLTPYRQALDAALRMDSLVTHHTDKLKDRPAGREARNVTAWGWGEWEEGGGEVQCTFCDQSDQHWHCFKSHLKEFLRDGTEHPWAFWELHCHLEIKTEIYFYQD